MDEKRKCVYQKKKRTQWPLCAVQFVRAGKMAIAAIHTHAMKWFHVRFVLINVFPSRVNGSGSKFNHSLCVVISPWTQFTFYNKVKLALFHFVYEVSTYKLSLLPCAFYLIKTNGKLPPT